MRKAEICRRTNETDINLSLCIDGGNSNIETGIGFFDHMLTLLSAHGGLGLSLSVKGDLEVDNHHTVEDTGIALGKAFSDALGSKKGIRRYGSAFVPMDECLCFAAVDISGRPFYFEDIPALPEKIGDFCTEDLTEFLRAFAFNAGITLHIKVFYGKNSHHIVEGIFKSLARALKEAASDTGSGILPSTKGVL